MAIGAAAGRSAPGRAEVEGALATFHEAFASGDAEGLTSLFAEGASLLLLHSEAREGRAAILEHWRRLFDAWDTGAWQVEPVIVDVHGDRAYTLSTYTETLVARTGGARRLVVGRLILFFQRGADRAWRVSLALNSHVRPVEELSPLEERPTLG